MRKPVLLRQTEIRTQAAPQAQLWLFTRLLKISLLSKCPDIKVRLDKQKLLKCSFHGTSFMFYHARKLRSR